MITPVAIPTPPIMWSLELKTSSMASGQLWKYKTISWLLISLCSLQIQYGKTDAVYLLENRFSVQSLSQPLKIQHFLSLCKCTERSTLLSFLNSFFYYAALNSYSTTTERNLCVSLNHSSWAECRASGYKHF